MKFIEPLREDKKLKDYLDTGEYKSVVIFFGHGIGDCIQFMNILDKLKELYPDIKFIMGLQEGLNQETIYPDAIFVNSREDAQKLNDYDLVAQINFPVETDPNLTKSELCCKTELGIELISGHKKLPKFPSKLVAVHFHNTALPALANPDKETAEKIWNEILEAGWIPIESHFEHVYHNPENKKFPFIDCAVRRCKPQISTLISLLQISGAFIGTVSGNFHCAMSVMPYNRIAFLEKEIPVERFTHESIKVFDIKNYQKGKVKEWLNSLT